MILNGSTENLAFSSGINHLFLIREIIDVDSHMINSGSFSSIQFWNNPQLEKKQSTCGFRINNTRKIEYWGFSILKTVSKVASSAFEFVLKTRLVL